MDKIKFNESVISKHVSINGYRMFIMINHEYKQLTEIQQSTGSKYTYYEAERVTKVSTFKDVRSVFNQLVNQGYDVIKDY